MSGSLQKPFTLSRKPGYVIETCARPPSSSAPGIPSISSSAGFGSARLSEFDLEIASPLETTRYMAPEAIAGGVAPASDWWSLGMILLERITGGACFEGVNEQAFLIHVLTNGVPLPENLDPSMDLLLRGLLARDRRERWQWKEVQAWLAGEAVSAPEGPRPADAEGRAAIVLGGKQYRSAGSFALAAAEAANWDEAKSLLLRGAVATWATEAGFEAKSTRRVAPIRKGGSADRGSEALDLIEDTKSGDATDRQGKHRYSGLAARPPRRWIQFDHGTGSRSPP